VTRSTWLTGALLAGLFLALHLPFLPPSLEDLDSINFALGVREYDVSQHQPHPPGYPLFIVAARILHKAGLSEVHALSLLSVLGGALGVFGCLALFRALSRGRLKPDGAHALKTDATSEWLAVLVATTCPLYWITAARPLSDAAGLAAALALQALIVTAPTTNGLAFIAGCAGFALGWRSQIAWLTVPVLGLAIVRLPRTSRWAGLIRAGGAYVIGALLWAVPLLIVSGPSNYIRTFWAQGSEDLTGVAMLATTHTVSLLIQTLRDQLIAPWGYWQVGAAVILLAMLGLLQMAWRDRSTLLTLVACFGPYMVFDLLFQEAITTRYALPLVIPAAFLFVRGSALIHRSAGVIAALAVVAVSVTVDDASAYGYAQMPAPAFRMLGDMHAAPPTDGRQPVVAMHRNQDFSMRRPIRWIGSEMPALAAHLPATPKHEWLEVVKYWNAGGRAPVWFVAEPLRSDLVLIHGQRRPTRYRWPFEFKALVGGARPDELDWYVFDAPDWYLGEGWALTPETAGVAAEDHLGAGIAPIHGWIRRTGGPITLVIGGRNLVGSGKAARIRLKLDGVSAGEIEAHPGFFLQMTAVSLPPGAGDYADLTVDADAPTVAIEQFDAQPADRVVYGFGEGWNEREYNPATGASWRWSSDRSAIRLHSAGRAVALTLTGEIEEAASSHVTVRAGDATAAAFDVGRTFSRTVVIPAALLPGSENVITIESSAWYVPAEKRWRSQDRRRLGLKLYECSITPAS
jgi:hypothetical protein